MTSEFELIRRYFARPTRHTALGVGDDAALIDIPPTTELAISADMLVAWLRMPGAGSGGPGAPERVEAPDAALIGMMSVRRSPRPGPPPDARARPGRARR